MHTQWQQFLTTNGATLDSQGQIQFNNLAEAQARITTNGAVCSLDHLGCIRASGADAQTFLQGQLSNDINLLDNQHVQFSAYCNPKGRMMAQFLIVPDNQDFLLLLPRTILEPTLKRLRMFVLRSQVVLTDTSDEIVCLGLAGSGIAGTINKQLPDAEYDLTLSENVFISKLPAPIPRFLLLTDRAHAERLWQQLTPDLLGTDQHLWHWLDIQAGLPSIWPQTVEEFVPQMLNLELINGVNFNKGCYPGQEIVARMHYLGKPKRRMYHLTLDAGERPIPGTDLYVAGGDGQSAGKVVLAEQGSQGIECLAVLQNDKAPGELRLGSVDGPKLTMDKLPYSLESA